MNTVYTSALVCDETPASGLRSGDITTQQILSRIVLGSGSGLLQANKVYSDIQTLAASGVLSYDLSAFGGSLDALGLAYLLTIVKGIMVRNTSTDPTAILQVGPAASNPWSSATGATTGNQALITPGGEWVLIAPSAAGLAVSNTNKGIKMTNLSSTATCSYQILVVGAQ